MEINESIREKFLSSGCVIVNSKVLAFFFILFQQQFEDFEHNYNFLFFPRNMAL